MRHLAALALLATLSAFASPAGADETPGIAPVGAMTVTDIVVPHYDAFRVAAAGEAGTIAALCAMPGTDALAAAREGFRDLLVAFSRVELYRFGPAREDNRIERLFFWPDRRGRGLRQVQGVIASQDDSAASVDTLTQKSVAVQGLPALEFVLFGTGSDALATGADFRCAYAESIALAIEGVAETLEAEWRDPFAALMADAGPDNPAYRTSGEAFQDLLQAAAEQLELISDHKIAAVIGETPDDAKPRLAPFWRSNGTIAAIIANLEGIDALLTDELAALLGEDGEEVASARYELETAREMLQPLADDPRGFEAVATDPQAHHRMIVARYAIDSARSIFGERMPASLGLISGFNSMDGD